MTITSLLDNDLYQFTMSAALFNSGWRNLQVRYEFRNRTFSVPLASRLSLGYLAVAIAEVQQLRFTPEDVQYLSDMKMFPQEWLDWLPSAHLPDVRVRNDHGHLVMTYEGNVCEAIFWETILLALVNESYFSRFGDFLGEGTQRLEEKIEYLRERDSISFVEFGTRRRFSQKWQHYVAHSVKQQIPELLLGTSNVALARELEIQPVGTMAHQLFMILGALQVHLSPNHVGRALGNATNLVLELWAKTYSDQRSMMTALPDTYTTRFFTEVADPGLASLYGKFRQDSGDPIRIGEMLQHYSHRIGQDQGIVFSDGLDVRSMSLIDDHFKATPISFGWGTNLTNDLGYEPLSLVIKPCAVQAPDGKWLPCVKISDDVRKATGTPAAVAQYLEAVQ